MGRYTLRRSARSALFPRVWSILPELYRFTHRRRGAFTSTSNIWINDVGDLKTAGSGDLSVFFDVRYAEALAGTKAGAVVTLAQVGAQEPPAHRRARLVTVAPRRAGPSYALPGQASSIELVDTNRGLVLTVAKGPVPDVG